MNNGANLVQVYAVIGGWNYEGESFDSLCLFDCKSTAEAYYQQLTEVEGYDYARMEIKEVEMKSLLAAWLIQRIINQLNIAARTHG